MRVAFLGGSYRARMSEVVTNRGLARYLALAHTEDTREWGELFSKARAARRE